MSVPRQRSIRPVLAVPMLGLALSASMVLTGCGSSKASSPTSTSSLGIASAPAASGTGGATPSASGTGAASATTTVTTTATTIATSAVPASSGPGTPGHGAPSSGSPTIVNATDLGLVAFATPSGRIRCMYSADSSNVRCDVQGASWTPAPGTPACDLDRGDSVSMRSQGAATLTCHGDTILGQAQVGDYGTSWHTRPGAVTAVVAGHTLAVLPYGSTLRLGQGMSCTSQTTGVQCSNAGGHSFTASLQGYRVA